MTVTSVMTVWVGSGLVWAGAAETNAKGAQMSKSDRRAVEIMRRSLLSRVLGGPHILKRLAKWRDPLPLHYPHPGATCIGLMIKELRQEQFVRP